MIQFPKKPSACLRHKSRVVQKNVTRLKLLSLVNNNIIDIVFPPTTLLPTSKLTFSNILLMEGITIVQKAGKPNCIGDGRTGRALVRLLGQQIQTYYCYSSMRSDPTISGILSEWFMTTCHRASSQLLTTKSTNIFLSVFREFYVIVTRADAIVQWFSTKHSWLQAAVLPGNHDLAFKELTLDLQACVSVFEDIAQHKIPFHAYGTIWRPDRDIEGEAQRDAENLRIKVEEILAQPATLGEEERLLAEYLFERERSMLNIDNQDVDLPGFCIGKGGYPTLGEPIGHGASGAVYKVEWLGMNCAKKHFGATDDEGSMYACLKEVSVLARLNHPHIVKLFCVSEQPEVSFLMELMPMSLHKFIKGWWKNHEDSIMAAAAIDIMLLIAQGMEHLHEQGIVHRDLKASNILLAPSGVEKLREAGFVDVKLTDFGLAKMKVHDLTNPSQVAGTTQWQAPEAFTKDQPIDWKKADAYSFAMTCSEVLTGVKPFSDEPIGRELKKLIKDRDFARMILVRLCDI